MATTKRKRRGAGAPTFAEWWRTLLEDEGLTQEQAAHRIGVTLGTAGRWARGVTRPRYDELERIFETFGKLPPIGGATRVLLGGKTRRAA